MVGITRRKVIWLELFESPKEVNLFLERLKSDWDRLPLGLKKPWNVKEALPIHAACGGYLAIMKALQAAVPQADFESHEQQLNDQFNLSYLDPDILHFLENTVPPVNLHEVTFVRCLVDSSVSRFLIFFCIIPHGEPWVASKAPFYVLCLII